MIESAMASRGSNFFAGDSSENKQHVAESAPSVLSWFAGTRSSGDSLDASQVLESATKWLASEGVTDSSIFEGAPTKSSSPSVRKSYTYDAPPAPVSTPKLQPKDRKTSDNITKNDTSITGSPMRSARFPGCEIRPESNAWFFPIPETAPLPLSSERKRQSFTERFDDDIHNSLQSKRKRERDSSSSISVEGLGQRLKRVCLKAKFHRRARHHVSSEDLTRIGSTEILPAPITPPDKGETITTDSQPRKKATARSLGTGIALNGEHEQVAFVFNGTPSMNATIHSLVTGFIDTQNETVQTQTAAAIDKNDESFAKTQTFGSSPMRHNDSIFLQPADLQKGVVFDESESDQELLFTESVSSDGDAGDLSA